MSPSRLYISELGQPVAYLTRARSSLVPSCAADWSTTPPRQSVSRNFPDESRATADEDGHYSFAVALG
jgi:hypothetical protein